MRETAGAVLIDTEGRFLFQLRDNIPTIVYPGMISLFGGHREADETFLQCVCREVREEISYDVDAGRFETLGRYSHVHPDGSSAVCEIFVARGIPTLGLVITEGTLFVATSEELPQLSTQMSPSARAAVGMLKSLGGQAARCRER